MYWYASREMHTKNIYIYIYDPEDMLGLSEASGRSLWQEWACNFCISSTTHQYGLHGGIRSMCLSLGW